MKKMSPNNQFKITFQYIDLVNSLEMFHQHTKYRKTLIN